MRGVLGFTVLSLGLGIAAYSYMPDTFDAGDPRLSFAASSAIAATLDETPDTGRLQEFSPGVGLKRSLVMEDQRIGLHPEIEGDVLRLASYAGRFSDAQTEQARSAPAPSMPSVEHTPWRAAVLVEPSGLGPNGTQVSAQFLSPSSRLHLVTALQGQLTRVGCYAGAATGSWDRETRAAVATFMDRVNAVLPVEEPDVTLLELVKAHPRATCDTSCPDGQSFDAKGRCVPLAVLASASRPRLQSKPQLAQRPAPKQAALASLEVATAGPRPAGFPAPMALGAGSLTDRANGGRTAFDDVSAASLPVTTKTALQSQPAKPRPQKVAQQARRSTSYRHVQNLFEHPLGRL